MSAPSLPRELDETLAAFETRPSGTPLTTTEVADAVDVGRRAAYDRLDRLAERDRLETKPVGARGRVWWLPPATEPLSDEPSFRALVEAVEEYAIFRLDAAGRVATWNRGAERIKGYEREEIVGEPIETFYTESDVTAGVAEANLAAAAAEGSVEDEGWRVRKDGSRFWASVTIAAITDDDGAVTGYTKVTKDLTERRRFEAQLRRQRDLLERELDEVFERVDDAFFALDEDWQFTYVNDQAASMVGLTVGEMLGATLWESLPEIAEGRVRRLAEAAVGRQETVEFEFYSTVLDIWIEVRGYPSESGVSVYFRDVTERKERERELERYRTIVETVSDGIYVVDGEGRFEMVNRAYAEMTGYDREDLPGRHVSLVVDEETVARARRYDDELRAGDRETARFEADLATADGGTVRAEGTFTLLTDGEDGPAERVGVVRDVTERVRRERELERYRTIVETVEDGIYVIDEDYRFQLVNEAYEAFVGRPREELLGSHISTVVDDATVELAGELRRELAAGGDDGGTVELEMPNADGDCRTVEVNFVRLGSDGARRGTTGVIRDVTERKERERELERQRERLAALDNLNAAVRAVSDSVIDQSTREEIERATCDRLSSAGSYAFAWIGDVHPSRGAVAVRVAAGPGDFFTDAEIPIDPDHPRSEGTIDRAVATREIQIRSDVQSVSELDEWAAFVDAHDLRAAAAIPIHHEDTLYGILSVYATRPGAFADEEREVIAGLGEVVGHAIAAVERKRALMSEEVVELEFRLRDFAAALDVEVPAGSRVRIAEAVPTGGDEFLVYGTATSAGLDVLHELTAALPHWEDVAIIDARDDEVNYQARLSQPPVLARVAELGGRVEDVVLEAGDVSLRVLLAPGTEIRQVTEVVQEEYPTAEMVSRRQVSRPRDTRAQLQQVVLDRLTERQRAVVTAAVNSGYFEEPRLSSGETIADSMGISAATFHQHLRAASRKVFAGVLPSTEDRAAELSG